MSCCFAHVFQKTLFEQSLARKKRGRAEKRYQFLVQSTKFLVKTTEIFVVFRLQTPYYVVKNFFESKNEVAQNVLRSCMSHKSLYDLECGNPDIIKFFL